MPEPLIYLCSFLLGVVCIVLISTFWYSPMLFGKSWRKLSGVDEATLEEQNKIKQLLGILLIAMGQVAAITWLYDFTREDTDATLILTFVAALISSAELFQPVVWESKAIFLSMVNTGRMIVSLQAAALTYTGVLTVLL